MLASLVLVGLALARPPEPRVVGPAAPVAATEVAPVRIVAGVSGGVVVDGCAPVELERKEAEGWKSVPTTPCAIPPPATAVATELTVSLPPPPPGEYRAVVAWGSGCAAGQPFAIAGCTRRDAVRSEPFVVTASATQGGGTPTEPPPR